MAELDLAKESIQKNEVREVMMGLKHVGSCRTKIISGKIGEIVVNSTVPILIT